jgi:hypothetical protein
MDTFGQAVPSLEPGSSSKYVTGHVRVFKSYKIRLQGYSGVSFWEDTVPVSGKLSIYIAEQVHSCKSAAGSDTSYVPCRMRLDASGPYRVRVQIAGPPVNRPWGVEFVVSNISQTIEATKSDNGAPGAPGAPSHAETKLVAGFKVGDIVEIVAEGDSQHDAGGPGIGMQTTILKIDPASTFGPLKLQFSTNAFDYWWTTPAKVKLVSPSDVFLPGEGTLSKIKICQNCGQRAGRHYPGGSSAKYVNFNPPLCPDTHEACPKCGYTGPAPAKIHALKGVCKGESKLKVTDDVPF